MKADDIFCFRFWLRCYLVVCLKLVPSLSSIACGSLMCSYFYETVNMVYEREAWMPNWPLDRISFKHFPVGSTKTSDRHGCGKCRINVGNISGPVLEVRSRIYTGCSTRMGSLRFSFITRLRNSLLPLYEFQMINGTDK